LKCVPKETGEVILENDEFSRLFRVAKHYKTSYTCVSVAPPKTVDPSGASHGSAKGAPPRQTVRPASGATKERSWPKAREGSRSR
jgi:hypothetical protein